MRRWLYTGLAPASLSLGMGVAWLCARHSLPEGVRSHASYSLPTSLLATASRAAVPPYAAGPRGTASPGVLLRLHDPRIRPRGASYHRAWHAGNHPGAGPRDGP